MNQKIQVLKGLSIIMVIIIHTNAGWLIDVLYRPFINFAVAMFIFSSGYLTKCEIENKKEFFSRRIKKVLIPYILWTVIYTLVCSKPENLIENLFTTKASGNLYYIFVYIQLVLLTPVIGKLLKSKYRNLGWIITPMYMIVAIYIFKFAGVNFSFPYSYFLFFAWFIYYYLGMALGNNIIKIKLSYKKALMLYGITLFFAIMEGLVCFWLNQYSLAITQIKLSTVGSSMMFLIIAYLFINDDTKEIKDGECKILKALARDSFGIYLSHMLILHVLKEIGIYYILKLFFPLNCLAVLVISVILVRIMRKLLGERLSKYFGVQ